MGINVPLMISVIFGRGLCARRRRRNPDRADASTVQVEMGYLMLMKAFAAAVVGGFGSLPGAIIGGLSWSVIFENAGRRLPDLAQPQGHLRVPAADTRC